MPVNDFFNSLPLHDCHKSRFIKCVLAFGRDQYLSKRPMCVCWVVCCNNLRHSVRAARRRLCVCTKLRKKLRLSHSNCQLLSSRTPIRQTAMGDDMINQSYDGGSYQPTMMRLPSPTFGQMQGRAQDTERPPATLHRGCTSQMQMWDN